VVNPPVQVTVPVGESSEPTPIIVDLQGGGGTTDGTLQEATLPEAPEAAGTAISDGDSVVLLVVSPSVADTTDTVDTSTVETTASLTLAPTTTWGVDSSGNPCQLNPDPSGTDTVTVPTVGATDLGKSANPLLAATEPIFPVQTLSSAVFKAPASGTFFGLALQNAGTADSIVSIDLWDEGSIVASASVALPSRTKISRDVTELFPGVTFGDGSFFQLTASVPVQMLGLSGNDADGSVAPVFPALASP
jgi:hypothetical protein